MPVPLSCDFAADIGDVNSALNACAKDGRTINSRKLKEVMDLLKLTLTDEFNITVTPRRGLLKRSSKPASPMIVSNPSGTSNPRRRRSSQPSIRTT